MNIKIKFKTIHLFTIPLFILGILIGLLGTGLQWIGTKLMNLFKP